jgi:hypothetical protein
MKKIVLTVVAMLSMSMAYAENETANSVNNMKVYDMTVNYDKLGEALGLTWDQMESLEDIHKNFCAEMMNAAAASNDERSEMVDKAIKKDLRYMHSILDNAQYHKYLLLLNTTMNNRGLNK